MSVLSCSRPSCDRIMCDTCIPNIGYMCFKCQDEFKNYLQVQGKTNLSESEIMNELKEFMNTEKDTYSEKNSMDINDFFRQYTI